jgi:lysophospholipase L1-like esterase
MRSRTLLLVLPVLLAVGCAQIPRSEGHEPLRVLFVGNSLTATNDLPAVVAILAKALGPTEVEYRTIAPGGVSLEDHWAAGTAPAALASGEWDAVVLQQGPSSLPESQLNLREWAGRFADAARANGVRPALLTVWPESTRSYALPAVIQSYAAAARAAGAELYPAGLAWQAAWRKSPKLPLYGPDGFHPSPLGTYLTALVVLAGLTNEPPFGHPLRIDSSGLRLDISPARAKLLQAAASEALAVSR